MRSCFFFLFAFLCFAPCADAQDAVFKSGKDLALEYYNNGEFSKAAPYYQAIYEKDPSPDNYQNYFKTLLAMPDFKDAEALARKQLK